MRLGAGDARALLVAARVARLATVRPDGSPHLIPVCFALDEDTAYTAVDAKPKRTTRLARLANVASEPRVALLADRYDDDWSRLWWARMDGRARLVTDPGERRRALELLAERYPQYRIQPPAGPVLAIDAERWSGWRHAGPPGPGA
jgi:PPOX class probable F420-dependent enzyme